MSGERPDLWPQPAPVRAGQESVWRYPRPPKLEMCRHKIEIFFRGSLIAETNAALRVLETSLPPGYYLPRESIKARLALSPRKPSWCEWKGEAVYYDLVCAAGSVAAAGWAYPQPVKAYAPLANTVSFYPALLDCYVGGEKARAQEGGFYGGWITSHAAGPFKGAAGSESW